MITIANYLPTLASYYASLCICYCFSHLIDLFSVTWLFLSCKFTRFLVIFVSLWRRVNARNVTLYYPSRQYNNLFIFRLLSIIAFSCSNRKQLKQQLLLFHCWKTLFVQQHCSSVNRYTTLYNHRNRWLVSRSHNVGEILSEWVSWTSLTSYLTAFVGIREVISLLEGGQQKWNRFGPVDPRVWMWLLL